MSKIQTFLLGPVLWNRAAREHHQVYKECMRHKPGTPEWDKAYAATWKPFNETFDHLIAAFIMSVLYVLAILGCIALVVRGFCK